MEEETDAPREEEKGEKARKIQIKKISLKPLDQQYIDYILI